MEQASAEQDKLPMGPLLALAMTGFIAIMTETMPAGLLPQIADGLGVSQPMAGQFVTLHAVGTVAAALPLTARTQGLRRKPTFVAAILGLLAFNTIAALSANYWLILAARFLGGVSAGLAWVVLGGYARRMVTDRLKGRALAIAMVGTPVALAVGVPLGAFIGEAVGWRLAFFGMSAATLVLLVWVLKCLPDFNGTPRGKRLSIARVFSMPGIRPVLATIFAWMTAHNLLYTYVAPFAARAGLGQQVDLLLLAFGVAALAGIWVTGMLVDRMLRTLVLVSLAAFAGVLVVLGLGGESRAVMALGVVVWGLSFGGAGTQLQTASSDAAGGGADLATAMIATVWNTAIAAGGLFGGVLLDRAGAGSFSWAVLPLVIAALSIAAVSRKHGFKPGARYVA
jgi:predicted MFS family arabinose efflux permease